MELPSEVLIYVQSIKNFFETNEDAKQYHMGDIDEKIYFDTLSGVALKNFKKRGEPELSKLQFEFLRVTLNIFKEVEENIETSPIIYDYTTNKIKFYLN
jgi:hypothetical protein